MYIILIQSWKIDADVWDIKRITGFWLGHLHSHTVPRSPLPALLQPFRQQQGISGIIPHLSSSAEFVGTGNGPLVHPHFLHFTPLGRTHEQCRILFYCWYAKLRIFHHCWYLQVQNYQEDQVLMGFFFVPVVARIVFFKKYKVFTGSSWFALPSLTMHKEEFLPLKDLQSWWDSLQRTAMHSLSLSEGLQTRINNTRCSSTEQIDF